MTVEQRARAAGASLRAATEPVLDVTDALHQTMRTSRRRRRNVRAAGIAWSWLWSSACSRPRPAWLPDRARRCRAPAISPRRQADPGVYTLVANPFLTGEEWAGFWGPGQTTTDGTVAVAPPVVRSDTDPSLIECVGDAHGLAAQEVQSATYAVGAEGGFNNEFILRYDGRPVGGKRDWRPRAASSPVATADRRDPAFLVAGPGLCPRGAQWPDR